MSIVSRQTNHFPVLCVPNYWAAECYVPPGTTFGDQEAAFDMLAAIFIGMAVGYSYGSRPWVFFNRIVASSTRGNLVFVYFFRCFELCVTFFFLILYLEINSSQDGSIDCVLVETQLICLQGHT